MNFPQNARKLFSAFALAFILIFTTACGASTTQSVRSIATNQPAEYEQLARGNSAQGQNFGDWVIKTSQGLIKDVYVRDNNKLGVVISPKVLPSDVKTLAKSLTQGFRHNFPDRDFTVLVYAPDKQLILTAHYDTQSKQIEYQQPS
ncbi:hypothetical protein TUMEXPCC7403_12845 [Tumidithrix helvetica PCC 7403]|uniref:hypothetical protein n=1 Tax=Tumidithrix helvetica TaxID=3457545 RepID=UPI003CB6DD84